MREKSMLSLVALLLALIECLEMVQGTEALISSTHLESNTTAFITNPVMERMVLRPSECAAVCTIRQSCQAFSVTRMGKRGYMCKIGANGLEQMSDDPSSRAFYCALKFQAAPESSSTVAQTPRESMTTPPQQTTVSVETSTSSTSQQVQANTTTTPDQGTTSSSTKATSPTLTSITSSSKERRSSKLALSMV